MRFVISFDVKPTYHGAGGDGGDASYRTISVNGGAATRSPTPSGSGIVIISYPTP